MDTRSRSAKDATGRADEAQRQRAVERLSFQIAEAVAEALDALHAPELSRPSPERLVSVAEAAERLGVARSTAYLLISGGQLKSVKLRKRRMVPEGEINRLARAGGAL